MVDIGPPGHQVPFTVGNRRAQFEPGHIGVRFRGIHQGGVFHVALFLTTDRCLHMEPVVGAPCAVQPAFRILERAANGFTVAILVVVRFLIPGRKTNEAIVIPHGGTAVDQPSIAVVGTSDGQVPGSAGVTKYGIRCGGNDLTARNGSPPQGAVTGAHLENLG